MKIFFFWMCFLLLGSVSAQAFDQQVFDAISLQSLIQQGNNDEQLTKERTSALEFHRLLNGFRKSRGKKELRWNDSLWLAARNHSLYLARNNEFSHNQISGKPMFSGANPTQRYAFVIGTSGRVPGCAENIYSASYAGSATQMAEAAFESWMKSPGHADNMLHDSYVEHGAAVVVGVNGMVYTDVFSLSPYRRNDFVSKPRDASPVMITESADARPRDRQLASAPAAPQVPAEWSATKMRKEVGNIFYYLKMRERIPSLTKKDERLMRRAKSTAEEILTTYCKDRYYVKDAYELDFSYEQISEDKAGSVIQQVTGKYKNRSITVLVAFKGSAYDAVKLGNTVYSIWSQEIKQYIQVVKNYGYSIGLKKKNNHFFVCATLEVAAL